MSLSFNCLEGRNANRMFGWKGETDLAQNILRTQTNFQDFKLTAAQMDTLNATPVEVLAAPGAGKINIVLGIEGYIAAGSIPFELGSGVLSFLLTDGSGAKVSADIPNASVESAVDAYYWALSASVASLDNAKIVAKASADVTAGNGTVYGRIYYKVLTIADLSL